MIASAGEYVAADSSLKPGCQGTTRYLKLGVLRLVKGRLRECSTLWSACIKSNLHEEMSGDYSTVVCRWVDVGGPIQVAEVVPHKCRPVATCTDSQKYQRSPEDPFAVPIHPVILRP